MNHAAAAVALPVIQVRLALAGKGPLDEQCYLHPGRKGCKVERLLDA